MNWEEVAFQFQLFWGLFTFNSMITTKLSGIKWFVSAYLPFLQDSFLGNVLIGASILGLRNFFCIWGSPGFHPVLPVHTVCESSIFRQFGWSGAVFPRFFSCASGLLLTSRDILHKTWKIEVKPQLYCFTLWRSARAPEGSSALLMWGAWPPAPEISSHEVSCSFWAVGQLPVHLWDKGC